MSIRVIIYRAGRPASVEDIEPELEDFRRIVGGSIEVFAVGRDGLAAYCRDRDRDAMPPNRWLPLVGSVHGDFVVFRVVGDAESSVTDADIEWCQRNVLPIRARP